MGQVETRWVGRERTVKLKKERKEKLKRVGRERTVKLKKERKEKVKRVGIERTVKLKKERKAKERTGIKNQKEKEIKEKAKESQKERAKKVVGAVLKWLRVYTTSFGVLIFLLSKFLNNVWKTKSKTNVFKIVIGDKICILSTKTIQLSVIK